MYKRINELLEICNIIFLLHCFRGKKIKIDIFVIVLTCAEMIIFELVNVYRVDEVVVNITYLLIIIYSLAVFGNDMKELILSNMLYVIVLGIIQIAVGMSILLIRLSFLEGDLLAIIINASTLIIVCLCRGFLKKFFDKMMINSKSVSIILIFYFFFMVQNIIQYKRELSFSMMQIIMIVILGILICGVSYCWQSEKEKRYEKELQLQMNQLYGGSLKELIETLQEKQHDFHNHIQAIKSQHYAIHTYDELVKAQEKYCNVLMDDSKYYKLLNKDNPIVTGFLYGKFIEADRQGINVEYRVELDENVEQDMPIHILVEIVGILWDNAIDFVKDQEERDVKIMIGKHMDNIKIEVSNPIYDISFEKINRLFVRGYSEKKNHSGIGLSKIKKYAEKYRLEVIVDKKKIGNKYWLVIRLENYKSLHS